MKAPRLAPITATQIRVLTGLLMASTVVSLGPRL